MPAGLLRWTDATIWLCELAPSGKQAERIDAVTRVLNLRYYKRFRMELDLRRWKPVPTPTPSGYRLLPWSAELLADHAYVKHLSFRDEIDAILFPCFGDVQACQRLMGEIQGRKGFVPEATWLAQAKSADPGALGFRIAGGRFSPLPGMWESCGTIQALRVHRLRANIQNIGVTPAHRGRGVGHALIGAALEGLRQTGVIKATLEVTADNSDAVRLYRRLGFTTIRTLYKAVDETLDETLDPVAS